MSAPPLADRLRTLLAEWEEDATAHRVGLDELEPGNKQQQRWLDEGYRRGILCAMADLDEVVPRKRAPRGGP